MKFSLIHVGWFGLLALSAAAAGLKIEMPLETEVFKPGPGVDMANAQCLICHSVEYVSTQPPMPRAFWKASIEKMQTKYGASIPSEQVDPLVHYLATVYGAEKSATTGPAAAPNPEQPKANPVPATTDGSKLAARNGCFGCHNLEKKIVGPAFQQVATKYKDNPTALAQVSRQITQGGSGQWGTIPMPPVQQLSEAEVRILAEWVLAQQR